MSGLASEVRIEEQAATARAITTNADTSIAVAGITAMGPVGESRFTQSFEEWNRIYGGYTANNLDVVAAVKGIYDQNANARVFTDRVVHCATPGDPLTKASSKATLNLLTALAAASAGYVESANAQPFDLEPGDTLIFKADGGADKTATMTATAAAREVTAAEVYAIVTGQTTTVKVDRGVIQSIAYLTSEFVDIANATAEEVAAVINAKIIGAHATVTSGGTKVTITSDKRGLGSFIEVTGGTAVALNFNTVEVQGTGNCANIDLVTAAEIKAALEAVPLIGATVTTPGGKVRITSSTTGVNSKAQITAASTADDELGFDNAEHIGATGAAVATLRVDGKWDGIYAQAITTAVAAATNGVATFFDFFVLVNGVITERFPNVTMLDTDAHYIETVVNNVNTGSYLVTVTDLDATPVDYPATGTFGPLAGGNDGLGALADADYTGGTTANGSVGLRCFDADGIDILIVPGRATSAVHNGMITYCEITRAGSCFPIFDPPAGYSAAQIVDYVENVATLFELTEFGAIYWPRIKVANPQKSLYGTDDAVVVAPSGHIAGLCTRNDSRKIGGAFEQPAGIDQGYGVPRNIIGLETTEVLKKSARELVFPKNINPISREKGTPIFLDGARPLKITGAWPSVGQRRGMIYIEKKLIPGLAYIRHRNITDELLARGEATIEEFMVTLATKGALASTTPSEAFFVDLGPGVNNAITKRARTVYARLGVATATPGEFVVVLVSPDTRALEAELAALANAAA